MRAKRTWADEVVGERAWSTVKQPTLKPLDCAQVFRPSLYSCDMLLLGRLLVVEPVLLLQTLVVTDWLNHNLQAIPRLMFRMEYRASRMDLALYSTLPCDSVGSSGKHAYGASTAAQHMGV